MADQMQINRRTILAGAALAGALAPVLATTSAWGGGAIRKASAAEIAALPRQKVELVDPPFVHAHSQVAEGGPKVIEFTMVIEERRSSSMMRGLKFMPWLSMARFPDR